ncbi:redoxin family protein [Nocardioides panacisoli]|uniref:TlpA family protein disulfide reductase n=1 Tax=Nocardioides panacisoli TaxID=627624 RepID=UPI001C639948|nr:redoxin family protein [Nocardioides panacisoli]QYJ05694.1 redoxin family protein [Nocardioides panacisoli]
MRVIALLVLAGVLAACGSTPTTAPETDAASTSGSSVADLAFEATALGGDTFEGESLEGQPTVLWFWAPWCPTCRAQIPNLTDLAARHGEDVSFVGVGGLSDEAAIAETAGDIDGLTHLIDPEGTVWSHFGVTAQSSYTVLDADGQVVAEGQLADQELTDVVTELARG